MKLQIDQNKYSRIICVLFLLVSMARMGHTMTVQRDSLLQYLKVNGTELTKIFLTSEDVKYSDKLTQIQSEYLLAFLSSGSGHEHISDSLAGLKVIKKMNPDDLKDLLKFIHASVNYLIDKKDAYISANLTGYKITLNNKQIREAYNFLSQLITYYRLFRAHEKVQNIFGKMKSLVVTDKYLQARYHILEGYIYMSAQDDRCIPAFQEGISMMRPFLGKSNDFLISERFSLISDSVNVASAYLEYSKFIQGKGDLQKAGELLIMGKKLIPADTTYIVHQITYYNSLSSIYSDLGNPQKAREYAMLSVDIAEKKNYKKLRYSTIALYLAKALVSGHRYDEALAEYKKVMKAEKPGSKMLRNTLLNIALVYHKMDNFDQMNFYLTRSDSLKVIGADQNLLSRLLHGYKLIQEKKYNRAINTGQEVLKASVENRDNRYQAESLLLLSSVYESVSNFAEGLNYFKQYILKRDSLYKQGQEMALYDLTAKYENEKKGTQIASLNETNNLKNSVISIQRFFLIALIFGALALAVFIYMLRSLNKKLRARNMIIEKSVDEKNILLREIHHRVKNNLQVISSLLKLQTGYIKDANAIQAITEGRSRVQAMAILHQNLYGDTSLTGVNIETYFENLIQGLFDTYNINEDKIHLIKNITPLILDVDTVIPLGLISNELISNALKHAFNESLSGKIEVSLKEINGVLLLKISDDGIGYIAGKQSPGFGSKLVQTLSDKLNASLEINNEYGCAVTITIREYQKVG